MKRKQEFGTIEDLLFVIGNICLVCFGLLWWWFMRHQQDLNWGCSIYRLTGLCCPACGGTRAMYALLHGRLWQSFCCHPGVLYFCAVCGWFLLSWYIEKLSSGRVPVGMKFKVRYVYIGLAIVMVQWIIKLVFRLY